MAELFPTKLTSDRSDPDLRILEPSGMQKKYLVLDEKERKKGFVRPVRRTYVHQYTRDGSPLPYPLVTLEGLAGCGAATTMGVELAETYARDPKFYNATYCVGCKNHFPLYQFHWDGDGSEIVGS